MFVSWLSAISFLGDPVEVYNYGSIYIFLGVGYCLSLPLIAHYFAPKYHKLGLISVFEVSIMAHSLAKKPEDAI